MISSTSFSDEPNYYLINLVLACIKAFSFRLLTGIYWEGSIYWSIITLGSGCINFETVAKFAWPNLCVFSFASSLGKKGEWMYSSPFSILMNLLYPCASSQILDSEEYFVDVRMKSLWLGYNSRCRFFYLQESSYQHLTHRTSRFAF